MQLIQDWCSIFSEEHIMTYPVAHPPGEEVGSGYSPLIHPSIQDGSGEVQRNNTNNKTNQ